MSHPFNSAQKREGLERSCRRGWNPPPRLSVPDWADKYRKLAAEAGSTSGPWSTAKNEVARGPMLAVTEPGVREMTLMAATQTIKTATLENIFGYTAHLDPGPMILVQPKEKAAEDFSKERITPMIQATPVLKELVGTRASRTSDDTLSFKKFPGGFLALVGAGSADNLARRAIKRALYDEVDRYVDTAEGDAIRLGDERLTSYSPYNLSVRVGSPTIEDQSRIADSFAESDQRRAAVECPHCHHRQFLDFFKHVEWGQDDEGEHDPSGAQIYCEKCNTGWTEGQRLLTVRKTVRWHQTRPFKCCGKRQSPLDYYFELCAAGHPSPVSEVWDWWASDRHAVYRAKCKVCGKWAVDNRHAGFQASKLFSPWPDDTPPRLAAKWLLAKRTEEGKQTFYNTALGVPYRPKFGKNIKIDTLLDRREVWAGDVPMGVAVLVAGTDVQPDRIELEVVGFGRGEESWSVAYEIFEGDPDQPEIWARVDEFLQKTFLRADGRPFKIEAACFDTGGHNTQAVYKFCYQRRNRKVWAIKGVGETNGNRKPVWPANKLPRKRNGQYTPVMIGVNAAKDRISSCLAIEAAGPGYMHFSSDRDREYFTQLTAERLILKKTGSRTYRVWKVKSGVRNEALDCRVYAYAALWGLVSNHGLNLETAAENVGATETAIIRVGTPEAQRLAAVPPPTEKPIEKKKKRRRRVVRSNVLSR